MQSATIRRKIKNTVKNYSEAEKLVREATSNDPWGASSTLMSNISDLTYNVMAFQEVMQMIWKRLNDKQKNWRHVYKALMLLEYILKSGSPRVVDQCRQNMHSIRTLTDFQHFEEHKDRGHSVRELAKVVLRLLQDTDLLKSERERCLAAKAKFAKEATGISFDQRVSYGLGQSSASAAGNLDSARFSGSTPDLSRLELEGAVPGGPRSSSALKAHGGDLDTNLDEETQLQLAIALSKEMHEKQLQIQRENENKEATKLQLAITASLNEQPRPLLDLASSSERRGPLPPVPRPMDPWGGDGEQPPPSEQPQGSAVRPMSGTFDPWASGGRTYLGFADQLPTFSSQDEFRPVSTAVPAPPHSLSKAHSLHKTSATTFHELDDIFNMGQDVATHSPWDAAPLSVSQQARVSVVLDPFTGLPQQTNNNVPIPKSATVQGFSSVSPSGNDLGNFLGENRALVDVNNIVAKPKGVSPELRNPFALQRTQPTVSNPFLSAQAAVPKPSLNTLATQQRDNGNGTSSPTFNAWPSSVMQSNHLGQEFAFRQSAVSQPQAASFNPFL